MSCMPKEFYTKEMKQALYNEWVDTYYNSEDKQKAFLVNLGTIFISVVAVFIVIAFSFEKYLSAVIIFALMIGLGLYIINYLPSTSKQQEKKNKKLQNIKKEIDMCND